MTFAQRRNRLTTYFSESIPVVKRRMTVLNTEEVSEYFCFRYRGTGNITQKILNYHLRISFVQRCGYVPENSSVGPNNAEGCILSAQ
jgi:hypothetical protein